MFHYTLSNKRKLNIALSLLIFCFSSTFLYSQVPNSTESEALVHAAQNNNFELVDRLLEAGADINSKNRQGQTVLHFAAFWGPYSLVKRYVELGAKVDVADMNGQTPIMLVYEFGSMRALQLLIDKGANVNKADKWGRTALMEAARADRLTAIKILLKAGANIKAQSNFKETALSIASDLKEVCLPHSVCIRKEMPNGVAIVPTQRVKEYLITFERCQSLRLTPTQCQAQIQNDQHLE
ncbi:MAG: ankyrin repeat domain-containing protein [Leptonema sp. (in: Bacteria)]|nr:ankyrin repeat domain-containing protein [Leptonema sp. (in: bacteria)]